MEVSKALIHLALFSGIAVATAFLASMYFLFHGKSNSLNRMLLAGFFVAVGIRIGKSIVYYLAGIPVAGTALGFTGLWGIGSFLWLYVKYDRKALSSFQKIDALHFLPAVVGFFLIWPYGIAYAWALYLIATLSITLYLLCSVWLLVKQSGIDSNSRNWYSLLLGSSLFICGSLVFQLFSGSILAYAWGSGIASFFIYVIFFYVLKNPAIFQKGIHTKVDLRVADKLKVALEEEKVYHETGLTVHTLAKMLEEPSYKISTTLKQEYRKNFPELINHFRIEEVKNKLSNTNGTFVKIESLAYEVGFSTPSAFYAAFKKETKMTPSAYRKMTQKSDPVLTS